MDGWMGWKICSDITHNGHVLTRLTSQPSSNGISFSLLENAKPKLGQRFDGIKRLCKIDEKELGDFFSFGEKIEFPIVWKAEGEWLRANHCGSREKTLQSARFDSVDRQSNTELLAVWGCDLYRARGGERERESGGKRDIGQKCEVCGK